MALYTLYAMERGATIIGQIQNQQIGTGLAHILETVDGGVDAQFIAVSEQKPTVTFTTTSIKAVLDMLPLLDVSAIDISASPVPVILYFRQRGIGASFLGTFSHIKMTIYGGLIHWTNLRATHPQAATIDVTITVLQDTKKTGGVQNDPITIVKEQSLGTAPTSGGIWTVGPWYLNGTLVKQFSDMSIDPGLRVETLSADGEVWPEMGFVPERRPVISGTTTQMGILDKADGLDLGAGGTLPGLGLIGVGRTGITRVFLRKRASGSAVEADSAATHIRFDVAAGQIHWDDATARVGDNAALSVKITPIATGGNAPIAVNTAVAIGVGA